MAFFVLYIFLNAYYVYYVIFLNAYYVYDVIFLDAYYFFLWHIYEWPIVVLSYFRMPIVLWYIYFSNQITQVIPSQDELDRKVKLFYPNRCSYNSSHFERAVYHLVQLIWVYYVCFLSPPCTFILIQLLVWASKAYIFSNLSIYISFLYGLSHHITRFLNAVCSKKSILFETW